jgi:hypothetical protein
MSDWYNNPGAQTYRNQQELKLLQSQRALDAARQGGSGNMTLTGGVVGSGYNPLGGAVQATGGVTDSGGVTGGGLPVPNPGGLPSVSPSGMLNEGQSVGQNVSTALGGQQSTNQQLSSSYIPEYSQTPILEEIAKYSRSMAPQVYDWGMQQFNKNQGNIDTMMRNALSYASPQRIAANMGMAEAGVQQGAEAGRQSAIRDLQGFGIDPSAGRYAALDTASRVQTAASAAGAGNQQRMADIAQGGVMQNQALAAGQQNIQTGYGAANAANALLGTASNLKYSPLGTASIGSGQSSGYNLSSGSGYNESQAFAPSGGANAAPATRLESWGNISGQSSAPVHTVRLARGGPIEDDDATQGGFVSHDLSPSSGAKVDDVNARLNAGEFVIPKDVSEWMGQKFFYELMAKARKMRAMSNGEGQQQVGYGAA